MYKYMYTHTQIYIHVYTNIFKAKKCNLLYQCDLTICHKPVCRQDIDNPLHIKKTDKAPSLSLHHCSQFQYIVHITCPLSRYT